MPSESFRGDPLAFRGKRIIENQHAALLDKLPSIKPSPIDEADPLDISDDTLRLLINEKVGILGAGIGGLYTALILDSLDIPYEILEASNRAGGRLSTYKFPNGGEYDYYEEGAMRFPLPKKENGKYKNGTMKRLAELIEYEKLNTGPDKLKDTLIPYYYSARDTSHPGFYYFNGDRQPIEQGVPKGPFRAQDMGVHAAYVKAGSDAIQRDVIDPFVRVLINDLETGSKEGWAVMTENDAYSVRGYMASKYLPSYSLNLPPRHLSNDVINWCNLLQSSSGGYDRALTEAVFSSMAFANVGDNNYGDVDWKCFRGGSETLSKKIKEYLESRGSYIKFNKRVTAIDKVTISVTFPASYAKHKIPSGVRKTTSKSGIITIDEDEDEDKKTVEYPSVAVKVDGSGYETYGHVISTLPLSVLRTVDLRGAGLNTLQSNALRALEYGPSIKIAILFKSDWWYQKLGIVGGQSFTDLPIRTIVYPSYGVDSGTPSRVLMASYAWTTDATRLGSLALKKNWDVLKELVLRNLAEAHHGANGSKDITYKFLVKQFEAMHVKDWTVDEYAMGAFAFFSPGEFENLYASLSVPAAGGCLHFAGEAVSTRHGWVVGALDSAWKSVFEYLKLTGQDEKMEKFKKLWGGNSEWTTSSTLLEGGPEHDLLEEHIALTLKAILGGIVGIVEGVAAVDALISALND